MRDTPPMKFSDAKLGPNDPCEVSITAPDREWLVDLCRQLVDRRLASSAHVVSPILSIYRWDGQVREAQEARALLRSRVALLDEVTSFVVAHHPYATPHVT